MTALRSVQQPHFSVDAVSRAAAMTDRELAGQYAAHTLVGAHDLKLGDADLIINNERFVRARRLAEARRCVR